MTLQASQAVKGGTPDDDDDISEEWLLLCEGCRYEGAADEH